MKIKINPYFVLFFSTFMMFFFTLSMNIAKAGRTTAEIYHLSTRATVECETDGDDIECPNASSNYLSCPNGHVSLGNTVVVAGNLAINVKLTSTATADSPVSDISDGDSDEEASETFEDSSVEADEPTASSDYDLVFISACSKPTK